MASNGAFFAPTYFSPTYFATLIDVTGAQKQSLSTALNDFDSIGTLIQRISSIGAFQAVFLDNPLDHVSLGSYQSPVVIVRHDGWKDVDDVDPISILRTISFSIAIIVRIADSTERFCTLTKLESLIRKNIIGVPLGQCLPGLTTLTSGVYQPHVTQSEAVLRLEGSLSYVVDLLSLE